MHDMLGNLVSLIYYDTPVISDTYPTSVTLLYFILASKQPQSRQIPKLTKM